MKNVQDIYPATPMQELMLLHALGQKHSDRLLSQFGFSVGGALDVAALEAAWNAVVARHPMLRTAFVTRKVPSPLQVVRQRVTVPFVVHDWRDAADVEERFAKLRHEDRVAGIDTQRAPLMRVTLVRVEDERWWLLWTSHHLLMDRWCLAPLFADLDKAYRQAAATGAEPQLPAAPSFRQYVDWLGERDVPAALDYWRTALRGFSSPTPLASDLPDGPSVTTMNRTLSADAVGDLHAAAKRFAVSPVALVQGALALVLAERHGRGDVVFGTAAAARPPAIANVEGIVGSFVNNLPVRVRCRRELTVRDWLRSIAESSFSRSEAEFVSPLSIAELASLPDNAALFDTLFVWLAPTSERLPLDMTPMWDDMATAYPLTISVAESTDALTLHVHQYADDPEHAQHVLDRLHHTLQNIFRCDAADTLGALLGDHVSDAPNPHNQRDVAVAQSASISTDDAARFAGRFQMPDILVRQFVEHQFARALDVDADRIHADEDFFALGGNSLKAAQLHVQICQGTRKNVPLLALFADPSINGMMRTLYAQDWPDKPDRMLALRESDQGVPLVCVASPEVNTLGYFVLSRRLPTDQAMYVLQLPPENERPQPVDPSAIDALASQYVEALRERQPRGPYQFLAMCGGAHLATAMSRELIADGEQVAFFGVVNTWSLYSVSWVYYLHRARRVFAYYRRRVRELLPGDAPPPVAASKQYVAVDGPASEDVGLANPWIRDVGFAHRWPDPAPLPTNVHVFRLERQQYWRIKDPSLGWQRFFTEAAVVDLPGRYHDNLMREPYVAELANALAPCLISNASGHRVADTDPPPQAKQQETADAIS